MRSHKVTLKVCKQYIGDVFHDRARIPESFRGPIREGRVCKICVGGKSALLEIRGTAKSENIIEIGELARSALGVEDGESHAFCIREVSWIGQFRWAWSASDSASRIAARLGVLGLFLGLIGIGLGIIALRH